MERLEDKLTITMIPEGIYREIAEEIGLDNFVRLTRIIGGSTCYFPKTESLLKPVRDEAIREEFNGYNHAELANKYGVTRGGSAISAGTVTCQARSALRICPRKSTLTFVKRKMQKNKSL